MLQNNWNEYVLACWCSCVCTHRTVHHCYPHNRCLHHSARGCGYSSRFGSETRPPRTPWELEREGNMKR